MFPKHWLVFWRKKCPWIFIPKKILVISPFYLTWKKILGRLQIFLHAGCKFLNTEEITSHTRNEECGYWCLDIWSRILHNWHFLEILYKYLKTIPAKAAYNAFWILVHSACISFCIPKRQAISTDTSFDTKMMVKIGAIKLIFKSHESFQSYLLTGQADSGKKAG